MASDKSISSGLSLPKWMKNKFGDRSDSNSDFFLSAFDHSGFYRYEYPESYEPQMDTKSDVDASQQTTMKRSSTAPDSQFKAAAAEVSTGHSIYSVAQNLFSGKFFGNYLSSDKNKEEEYKNRDRRNSQSLPASPLNSRRVYRKNPYFTDPFVRPDEQFDGKSFLYLSLSSPRRSLENLVDPPGNANNSSNVPKGEPRLVPKPSELRELNCWSPIST